jgi:hypothetical protein
MPQGGTLDAANGARKLRLGTKLGRISRASSLGDSFRLIPTKARLVESFDGTFGSTNHLCDPAERDHDS